MQQIRHYQGRDYPMPGSVKLKDKIKFVGEMLILVSFMGSIIVAITVVAAMMDKL